MSTGHALLLGFGIAAVLGVVVFVPLWLYQRRQRRLGLPPENFWSQALSRDTVERQMVVSSAARAFALLFVVALPYEILRIQQHWSMPTSTTIWTAGLVAFQLNLGWLQLQHRAS